MNQWIAAGLALAGGVLIGAVTGWAVRRMLARRDGEAAPNVARPAGLFLFWFFTFLGIVVGVGILTPATLDTVPRQVLAFLPRVLVAGLILLGSWAAASVVTRLVRHGLISASGEGNRSLELVVRAAVLATGAVFAVAQLGVDTTVLTILAAVIGSALALAFALLVGLGGRAIAAEIAAGRYLARHLREGGEVELEGERLTVRRLHPASIELVTADGSRRVLPYSRLLGSGFTLTSDH